MRLTKSYNAHGTELEVSISFPNIQNTTNSCKILTISTYYEGKRIPLCIVSANVFAGDLVKDNPFFETISKIILDIPKVENALETVSNGWAYKDK